jgi:hypothetical protein
MASAYTGGCACGQVTLAMAGEPVLIRQCWCRQCRRIAAGGPANNAAFKTEDVAITGTLGSHAYVAASGNTLTQWFCPSCGTPLTAQSSARPHLLTVRFGAIDDRTGSSPRPRSGPTTRRTGRWSIRTWSSSRSSRQRRPLPLEHRDRDGGDMRFSYMPRACYEPWNDLPPAFRSRRRPPFWNFTQARLESRS